MDLAAASQHPPSRDDAAPSPEGVDWTLKDVLFGALWFVGLFVAGQIVIAPFAFIYGAKSGQLYASAFVVGAFVEVGIALVAAHFTLRRYGGGWERLGFRPPTRSTFLWAGFAVVGALAVSLAYGVIIDVAHIDALKSNCAEQIPQGVRDERALLALASLTVILFAPICEEMFFRGFMFTGLWRGWGLVAGIVVSGLLFASAHLLYKSFIPIAGVGIVLAYTYYRSRNLLSAIMAHMVFNSLSIAFIAGGSCNSASGSLLPLQWLSR